MVGIVRIQAGIPYDVRPAKLLLCHDLIQILAERLAELLAVFGQKPLHILIFPYPREKLFCVFFVHVSFPLSAVSDRMVIHPTEKGKRKMDAWKKCLGDLYECMDVLKQDGGKRVSLLYDRQGRQLCVMKQQPLETMDVYRAESAGEPPCSPY